MSRNVLLLVMILLAGLAGCLGPQDAGYLEGQVTIGPICPVERPGEVCEPTPETYEARKIVILDQAGNQVELVDINATGYYQVSLSPGTYTVDINHAGIDHSPDVPAAVTILAGQTMVLDISIDTGIR